MFCCGVQRLNDSWVRTVICLGTLLLSAQQYVGMTPSYVAVVLLLNDENSGLWVQTMICFVISSLLSSHRHDAIIQRPLWCQARRAQRPLRPNWVPLTSLHLNGNKQIWNTTKMVFISLALTLDRSVNTFKEGRNAREAASGRQKQTASGANDVAPLLDVDAVPFNRRDLSCQYCTTALPVTIQLRS